MITYIVIGFAFVSVFNFVAYKSAISNTEHLLISSLVIGFVGTKIFNAIPWHISDTIDLIGMTLSTIIIAFIVGRFYVSRTFRSFLFNLGVQRDVYEDFWDEVSDPNFPYKVKLTYGDVVYEGYCRAFESYKTGSRIVLARYTKSVGGTIEVDNTNNKTEVVMLNTAKADEIVVSYYDGSYILRDAPMTFDEIDVWMEEREKKKGRHRIIKRKSE